MKWQQVAFLLVLLFILVIVFVLHKSSAKQVATSLVKLSLPQERSSRNQKAVFLQLRDKAIVAKQFATKKGYSTKYSFLIDMSLPSGAKRFFIYDLEKASLMHSGLVAHGSCRSGFSNQPVFSNTPDCGCSSVGKYKVGYGYNGQFGKAFKLHGLENTNSNAFKRTIVLHAYDCVPDEEVFPRPICNSLGCPMVSYQFLNAISGVIEKSGKPILLWIYN